MNEIGILGIVGSLRKDSYNHAALRAAQELVPDGAVLNLIELHGIPIFNQDGRLTDEPTRQLIHKLLVALMHLARNQSGGSRTDHPGNAAMMREGVPARTVVLRRALSPGCSLWAAKA